jgi:hypothetical protein
MKMIRQVVWSLAVLMVVGLLFLSFSVEAAPPGQSDATPVPTGQPTVAATSTITATGTVTPTAAPASTAGNGASETLDLSKILPADPGRELVLEHCVGCHSIAPIAVAAKSADEWDAQHENHSRFLKFSQADQDVLYKYLKKYFAEDRVIPDLPPELLQNWTTY